MCYTKLRFDCLKFDRDISQSWDKKSDKIEKSGFELIIIKNPAIKS